MPRRRPTELERAHDTIRGLRNQLGSADHPLRVQIRELEDRAARVERERNANAVRIAVLEEQGRIREALIKSLLDYVRLSSGNGG